MRRSLVSLATIALLAGLGLVHGQITARWGDNQDLADAVQRLGKIPPSLHDWQIRPLELDPAQVRIGEIAGSLARQYENPTTGAAFTVMLLCGRPGPIAVHTPDVCYQSNGYAQAGAIVSRTIELGDDRPAAEFSTARFDKHEGAIVSRIRVWWSWTDDGVWRAPRNPRITYAGRAYLCKFYVVHELATEDEKLEDDPSREFIKEFLSEVDGVMWPRP